MRALIAALVGMLPTLVFSQSASSSATSPPNKLLVGVALTGDSPFAEMAKSYFMREMRKLSDVQIVDDKYATIEVSGLIMQTSNVASNTTGFDISYVVTSRILNNEGRYFAGQIKGDPDLQQKIVNCFDNGGCVIDHFVQTGA